MKKKLSEWLLRVAKKLNPQGVIENVPEVEDYKPMKIGMRVTVDKKDIRKYKFDNHVSEREARKAMISEAKRQIRNHVIDVITKDSLIEYVSAQEGKDMYVEGHLKVYIKK